MALIELVEGPSVTTVESSESRRRRGLRRPRRTPDEPSATATEEATDDEAVESESAEAESTEEPDAEPDSDVSATSEEAGDSEEDAEKN